MEGCVMTGFESKRRVAQAKLDEDDDTQVYSDTLLLVYQRGFADGKRSAQRKPLTDERIAEVTGIYPTMQPDKWAEVLEITRDIEAAHGIKENT
jgi:hypothetical protein